MQKQKYVCAVLSDLLCVLKLNVWCSLLKLTCAAAVHCRAAKFLPYITGCHIMTNSKLTEGL